MNSIPTFVINLKKRTDRKEHILRQFSNREEFRLTIIEAIEHEIGSLGLWETIKFILSDKVFDYQDFILVCEDDHEFSAQYSKDFLFERIAEAQRNGADILCGGVSWFGNAFAVTENVFWIEGFTGFQFTIIFRPFFETILQASFDKNDAADLKVSKLTENKFLIFPFISSQKEFGYSDATFGNDLPGKIEMHFDGSLKKGGFIKSINDYINRQKAYYTGTITRSHDNITIPTYIIKTSYEDGRRACILEQFEGKDEFDLIIVEAYKHGLSSLSFWLSIRKIVEMAILSDEDLIIIGKEDLTFTSSYCRELFLRNVMEAYFQRIDLLLTGISAFDLAIPVSKDRFWINHFCSAGFMVLNKNVFKKILDYEFDDSIAADAALSKLTNSKMALFPFISTEGKSEFSIIPAHNRLEKTRSMYCKLGLTHLLCD